jgi:hypothetical protein
MIYYKSSLIIETLQLPFYFGYVHVNGLNLEGRHYKPKFNKLNDSYTIGYYRIKGDTLEFLRIFQQERDSEITPAEFERLLAEWQQAGGDSPVCWGPGEIWEVGKLVAKEEAQD